MTMCLCIWGYIALYMVRCYPLYCKVCPYGLKTLFINLVKNITEVYKRGHSHWKLTFVTRQGWINVMKKGLRNLPLSPLRPTTDAVEYLHPNAPTDTVKDGKRQIDNISAQKSRLFKAWWAQSLFFLHRHTHIWMKPFSFSWNFAP